MQAENAVEIWKDVVNYEGLYKVSNLGRVKRLARSRLRLGGKPLNLREKVLKPNRIKGGYYQLKLTKDEVEQNLLLHRLVCESFHGPAPTGKPHVNHRDANKENNAESNLEWCSFKENMEHAALHGLRPRGSGNHYHKIVEADVIEICRLLDTTSLSQREIASRFGIDRRSISNIKTGVSWNWLTHRKSDTSR